MRIASFFAGVGGIDFGFEKVGFKTIWANEIDSYAGETLKSNFEEAEVIIDDIKNVNEDDIPDFDIMTAGFPCQPFSLAGYRKGFDDNRGNVFFELVRIIRKKRPKVVFLENVKNLVGHDSGNTFRTIIRSLKEEGYKPKYKVLNASEFGNIPQNRERIYIVAFLNHEEADSFYFPDPVPLDKKLNDVIDYKNKLDDKYYYTEEKNKFYEELKKNMINKDTIYQWRRVYVRENKSNLCPTLTANMGTGGHNVPLILTDKGIRKLTPRECFNLQGFDENFKIPLGLSNTRLYKQAGNSVVVPVIERIAKEIKKVIS